MTNLTIREAAAATKLSEKALRRRHEKGQLRAARGHDGLLRIPESELRRVGLLPVQGQPGGSVPADAPEGRTVEADRLIAKLLEQERQLFELRALPQRVEEERVQLESELVETRAEVVALERRNRELEARLARRGLRRLLPRTA
jgi:hypothetical protein